jgi:hypothetical protein
MLARLALTSRRLAPIVAALVAASWPSAAGAAETPAPRWFLQDGLPAQAFPASQFNLSFLLTNIGAVASQSPLDVTVTAPPGLSFSAAISATKYFSCKGSTTLECTLPAGQHVGAPSELADWRVLVAASAPLGPARFQIVVTGDGPPIVRESEAIDIIPAPRGYGIADAGVTSLNADGSEASQAGAHPYGFATTLRFTTKLSEGLVVPAGDTKDITVDLPPGYIGNPQAIPVCNEQQLDTMAVPLLAHEIPPGTPPGAVPTASCPAETQVGEVLLTLGRGGGGISRVPLFNVEPEANAPAEFGFNVGGKVVHMFPEVRPGDEGITVRFRNTDSTLALYGGTVIVWGGPSDAGHDALRDFCGAYAFIGSTGEGCPLSSGLPPTAFFTNPSSCGPAGVGLQTPASVESWEGEKGSSTITSHDNAGNPLGITGCERVPFEPSVTARPTTESAETATGLDLELGLPTDGILNPEGLSESDLRKTVLKFPPGMTLNPSAGSGLGACTQAQYESEALFTPFGAGCPSSSLLGTVEITTPVLAEKVTGYMYLAQPYHNPSGSLVALYMVVRNVNRGVIVKAAGSVVPDPSTGQITSTFDNLPQLPFAHILIHLREGSRAPLVTPPACGHYVTEAALTPWSAAEKPAPGEVAQLGSPLEITTGVNGGSCPSGGTPPLQPKVVSGTQNNNAASYTSFYLRILREDGEQELTKFNTVLPPGLTANLTGIPFCSDAQIQAAREQTGQQALEQPACPAASEIGHTLVGAGVGPVLAWTPGKVYLAGSYHGSGLSIVSITSATVGPFDLGTVVIRFALRINPTTGQAEIDGSASDPIPHIIRGIVVHVRDIHVYVDRSKFMLDPTSCARMSIANAITGDGANPASTADDQTVAISTPFQAADCASLAFKPTFAVSTSGRTSRAGGASLDTKVSYPAGSLGHATNLRSVKVSLPRQLPSRLTTLQKACTDKVFNVNPANCPAASLVGTATTTTPIVPVPLTGPAYFVSHGAAKFPELIIVLQGYGITIDLHGETFIDEKTSVTTTTFSSVPDQPFESFELKLPQGPNSALSTSANLCAAARGSTVSKRVRRRVHGRLRLVTVKVHKPSTLAMPTVMTAQNGAVIRQSTAIKVTGCAKKKAGAGRASGKR